MKKIIPVFILLIISIICAAYIPDNSVHDNNIVVPRQDSLDGNNISAMIWDSGVFDQDLRTNNTPGFYWPRGTTHAAVFTAGLTLSAYVNNQIRLAAASYKGEYRPGYCVNGVFFTNNNFKIYKVKRGDNSLINPDWANWGLMVPYGAPFEDVNNNGIYEPAIDKAGVKGSAQTIFVCLTDADPTTHSSSEGFGGGTPPLGAEAHLTAWCYDNPGYGDMQFLKWTVINRNNLAWDSVGYSIVSDPDLGEATDDYIGCDTTRNLGICYNADDQDGNGTGLTYGAHPPAIGFVLLNCNNPSLHFQSFIYFANNVGPVCELDPLSGNSLEAYLFLHGFKKDRSSWMNPFSLTPTFFVYPGNPANPPNAANWTEFGGRVTNCNGTTGQVILTMNAPGDRRMIMNFQKNTNQRMNLGDTQIVQIAQMIARDTNNLNSVTLLKQEADVAKQLCENNFIIGIQPISNIIPKSFSLSQNYPNPFNPSTKIRFEVSGSSVAQTFLSVYDVLGKEIATLVNEQLKPGTYYIEFNAANYPSGVYFYKLVSDEFTDVKKMVLIK